MRTPKYTNEEITTALRDAKGLVYVAAAKMNCSPRTIYARMEKVQEIQQAVDDARGLFVDNAEQRLAEAVDNGEPWAVQFTLKTLGKNRGYTERQEISGPEGGPIRMLAGPIIEDMDDDQLRDYIKGSAKILLDAAGE